MNGIIHFIKIYKNKLSTSVCVMQDNNTGTELKYGAVICNNACNGQVYLIPKI